MTAAEADPSWTKTNVSRSQRGPQGSLRTRLAGLAALVGVLLGALALPTAAQAQDKVAVWISAGHNSYIDIGGAPAIVTLTIQPNFQPGDGPRNASINASLSGLDGYISVDTDGGDCTRNGPTQVTCQNITAAEGQRTVQFALAPATESDIPLGETRDGKIKFDFGGDAKGNEETGVTVAGNAQAGPRSVTAVTGKVTSNAEPVSGAKVVLTDGEGTDHQTDTNDNGEYSFEGSDQGTYIAPGEMKLSVTKEDFEDLEETFEVAEGSSYQRNVTLAQVEQEESAQPTEEASEAPSSAEASPTESSGDEEGGISGTLLFLIIVGALLVIGGIVGIVFLLRGGKDDKDDDDSESFAEGPPDHQPTAAQVGSPGVYQAGPAPGGEAPTMIHNGPLVADQEVGSYGAPTSGFGPAYGNDDSTQVMPQAGGPGAPPPPPPPPVGPDDTQILSTVKGLDNPSGGPGVPSAPHGFGNDSTQVMPQAGGPGAPPVGPPGGFGVADQRFGPQSSPSPSTQPHPSPSPTQPHPSPTPAGSSMFEPQNPAPPPTRDPYAPPPQQSQPPPEPYPSRPPTRDPYAPPTQYSAPPAQQSPPPAQYSAPPAQHSAPPAGPYTPQPTQAMPQGGFDRTQPPASPYGAEPQPRPSFGAEPQEGEEENSRRSHYRRDDEERRGWGEWDDRPRSW